MKPGQHPEFFRFPAPAGRSRESSIVLDENGVFWHEGHKVERPSMAQAFSRWLRRHPDDGRFILSNDYDWTYLQVKDVPFFIISARVQPGGIRLVLSDGSEEDLDLSSVRVGARDALYCRVKAGGYSARFQPAAQLSLAPALREDECGRTVLSSGAESIVL